MATTTLAERILNLNNNYNNSDENWVQFIQDHKSYLMKNSVKVSIPPEVMFNYRYRPEELIRSYNYDKTIMWIIMWLNQLSYTEFNNITELWFPDINVLNSLKNKFKILKAKQDSVYDKYSA